MGDSPTRVLLVEDDPDEARLVRETLESGRKGFEVTVTETLSSVSGSTWESVDVVLLDVADHADDGSATVGQVHRMAADTPIVAITRDSRGSDLACREAGALECVSRGLVPEALGDALRNAAGSGRDGSTLVVAPPARRHAGIDETAGTQAENLRNLIQRNADALIVVDPDGVVQMVNPAAERLFRRPASDIVGDRFGFPLVSDSKAEVQILRTGGDVAVAEMRMVDARWNGGRAYLASLRDVTDRKREQQALEDERRHQMELKDQLLSHASHELRTPLSAIHGFVSLVLDEVPGPLNEDQKQYLTDAFRNVKQLERLIGDLTDVARARAGKLHVDVQALDAGEVADEAVRAIRTEAARKNVTVKSEVERPLPPAMGDEARVRQVLANLLDNAIKFTPEKGSVTVHVRGEGEGNVLLSVRDTGFGIPPDSRKSIFEELVQRSTSGWSSRKGLGLGLFICRELVERQGGRIWVDSEVGKGSVFHFTLPVFDLARQLAPALTDSGRLRDRFCVVRIRLEPKGRAARVSDAVRRHALHVLRACIYPDTDVVVPEATTDATVARYLIVAATDDVGLRSLTSRVRPHLESRADVDTSGILVDVSGEVWEPSETERNVPVSEGVQRVTQRIEELIGSRPTAGR